MKPMLSIKNSYVSSSCNKCPHTLDWINNGYVCYGTNNGLAYYQPFELTGDLKTVAAHNGTVNCVRWVKTGCKGEPDTLVAASSDKTASVWKLTDNTLTNVGRLIGHTSPVNICVGAFDPAIGLIIATGSADSTIKIWTKTDEMNDNYECIETISLGNGFALSMDYFFLPETECLCLACGCDDFKIHLYYQSDNKFKLLSSLVGHEDWVRSIDSTQDGKKWRYIASIWKSGLFFESVLLGHENWIYSTKWFYLNESKLSIVSASMDKTLVIWQQGESDELWVEKSRLGDVGGNTLGFYDCKPAPDGSALLAYSFHGAFHMWLYDEGLGTWKTGLTVGGHFEEVQDIAWEPKFGAFLLSVSSDQTTRLHAKWKKADKTSWYEMGRPQVHGYDMKCIAPVNSLTFASGADEKVIRAFRPAKNFLRNFNKLTGTAFFTEDDIKEQPEGASIPALGLSNKSVYETEKAEKVETQNLENYFSPIHLEEPPTEENLVQNTLWPEIVKLYGHGYEIFALAARNDGGILASSCKAAKAEHASVILWNTSNWEIFQKLSYHNLTVTDISFSHDGQHILLVSRDRTWSLFSNIEGKYELTSFTDKKTAIHSRIIWCCAWSHDDAFFITGSRDKKAIVWSKSENSDKFIACDITLQLSDSITAIDLAPKLVNDEYVALFGLDNGEMLLYTFTKVSSWTLKFSLSRSFGHQNTVKRIRFKPTYDKDKDPLTVASCSVDHSVKIYEIMSVQ
ncbi:DgyrCDS7727 [Dimorphilus gyrociliatus]|uniref:Elongator complex protein 2 n=1 Tax=Dimorphilus gyrociliatus TaxID=2664684 RepID=A0A7I8VUH6_9ANNE|nr:DgyrCDS7727 [Dimorphilus gyrociliatus]